MKLSRKKIIVLFKRYLEQKKEQLTPKQRKMFSIVRKTVINPKSTLTVNPITGTCYAECNGYYIVLTNRNIDIYGTFNDSVAIEYTYGDKLLNFFYSKVNERRIATETIYINKTLGKLDVICAEVSQVNNKDHKK